MLTTANTDDDALRGAGARRRGSNARLLGGALTGSAALHAAVLVALPGWLPAREDAPVRVLEVALVQAETPPQVIEQALPPPAPLQARERVARAPMRPEPARQADAPAPVLALPEPRAAVESSFTVPAPRPAETPPAPPEAKTEVASLAVTPASFGASYLSNPAPTYPMTAKRNNVQGTVTLRVLVTREGLPARVELERTSGSTQLDQAALDTIRTWRFAPARRGAEPVEDTVIVPIVFRLERAS